MSKGFGQGLSFTWCLSGNQLMAELVQIVPEGFAHTSATLVETLEGTP